MVNIKQVLVGVVLFLSVSQDALAGLIFFDDRDAFEQAVDSTLAFEGFNDNTTALVDLQTDSNWNPYRSTSTLVSEGERARSIREYDTLTVTFDYDVFAIGFDVNELNSNNLTYSDSAGHEVFDALKVTDVWYASTFFGVISDTALRSFSLAGNGVRPGNAIPSYGFDALAFTASNDVQVPAPEELLLTILAVVGVVARRRVKH